MILNKPGTNVKLFCRFRALESSEKCLDVMYESDKELLITPKSGGSSALKFEYDHIFGPEASQEAVFEISAKPIIDDVFKGFNGTIFAYGQTNSGKTYTMAGSDIIDVNSMGIIPRMISLVFDNIDSSEENIEYSIKVSYFELYLEKICDLTDIEKKGLKIRENRNRGIYIQNLSENFVSSDYDVFEILRKGTDNRHMTSTNMNVKSSRSHTIFTISVYTNNSLDLSGRTGKLSIVDLAGSERVSKTGAEGLRLKELQNINKSLNALTSVINSLTDGKSTHIPYRDSKLTRILQDSLGGNSNTAIIITCSLLLKNESETITTLRFGSIAKAIKNRPKVNRELTMAELKLRLMKIEEELKKKAIKIASLEETLAKYNISITEINDTTDDSIDININDNDEFLIQIEEASNTLSNYIEDNLILKRDYNQLKQTFDDYDQKKEDQQILLSILEEKKYNCENGIKTKTDFFKKITVDKDLLLEKLEKVHSKKIELEKNLNEKVAESNDLKLKLKVYTDKQETFAETSGLIDNLKEKLMTEQQKYKKNQSELQDLQFRYGIALKDIAISKKNDENEILYREIKSRNDKIENLEQEINEINESHKLVKKILSEDESNIIEKTDELEKKVDELSELYKQLITRQSSSNIEKQINIRKIAKLTEKIRVLEEDLSNKKEALKSVEINANKILDEMATQSIFNKIRIPIRGGGGKGLRQSYLTRLSIKPRPYSSLKFN
jgi:kinesin family member 5